MATAIQNLMTMRDNIAAELAAMDSTKAGGKPDAGKSGVSHVAYFLSRLQALKDLNETIKSLQSEEDGPFEIISEMGT